MSANSASPDSDAKKAIKTSNGQAWRHRVMIAGASANLYSSE
jgi:hypothetical protein